jgi:tRNA (guanine10-N2)-dimethyltransferase
MYIALLGRQPALGIAELERVFGGNNVTPLSNLAATIDTPKLEIQDLGGALKAGIVTIEITSGDWHKVNQKIVQHYSREWATFEGKITLGLSAYGFDVDPRDVQKIGLVLKQKLKKTGGSLRLVPNQESALSTATSHHNKLGLSDNKVELLIVRAKNGKIIIAESTGAQNITAYTKRDQERPKRDAFVGMLPPKLAQIMINLANPAPQSRILDPFCGTGVILQEAALRGFGVYGSDLAEKMIRYSRENLNWLVDTHHLHFDFDLHEGDAMETKWQQPIGAVVAETYLGQPFSAPPSPAKLDEVRKNCNHILTEFLKNLSPQVTSGTPVCIAIPAWRSKEGNFTHLPLITTIAQLGFKPHEFNNISQNDLLYYREDQVVARELLVLTKI